MLKFNFSYLRGGDALLAPNRTEYFTASQITLATLWNQ